MPLLPESVPPRKRAGNYAGRKSTRRGWKLDPAVTAYTSRPWFHGKPCKRCGSTVRFVAPVRQCVRCLKQWRKENRHKWKRRPKSYDMRANPLFKSHGFGLKEYEAVFELQGGVCAICKKPEKDNRRLSVDHCHETGAFRGLLCNRCNRGLGLFLNSPQNLISAAAYLLENPWLC